MSLGRRKVTVDDQAAWVFNRMADVYDARPAYPGALLESLSALARAVSTASSRGDGPPRVVDLGAGIGHLALPLAVRGLEVTAVEPAAAMLARLREGAAARQLALVTVHAAAEALPLDGGSLELAVVADALHFMDAARVGAELRRVLAPRGALAIVTVEPGETPFMTELVRLMEVAAPRRPRDTQQTAVELAAVAGIMLTHEVSLCDEVSVDAATLERILRSISYIGPAMSAARFSAFSARVRALPGTPRWARRLRLRAGRRR